MGKPTGLSPEKLAAELAELNARLSAGLARLTAIRNEDVTLGQTPKDLVYSEDRLKLYRFKAPGEQVERTPLLIVYSLVSRHTMTDLQPDRSMVRNLLGQGLDVYLIDWGYPMPVDRWLTTDDYVNGYLESCVEWVCDTHGLDAINVLGICQGGVLALCYAALHPKRVKNLVLTLTPVDFHADEHEQNKSFGFVNLWQRNVDVESLVDAFGNVPGDFMAWVFSETKPLANVAKYATAFVDALGDDAQLMTFLRMEKWISDNPDFAGEACKEWMRDLYQQNKLVKDELELGGRPVRLANVTMPVLNVYAEDDHLVPPMTSRALRDHVGTEDYAELALPGGHIGVYVGARTQKTFAPAIASWLAARA